MKKLILALLSATFLLLILAIGAVGAAFFWYQQPGPLSQEATLIIEPGTGFNAIAEQLKQAGIIEHALLFRGVTVAQGAHRDFKAGEYRFQAGAAPQEVAQMLIEGKSITHAITIPEGKSSAEIIALLMADDRLSGMITTPIPEGSLLPDTHHIHRGDTRQSVVDRMREGQEALLAELWPQRAKVLPFSTPAEAVALASIVEKETGIDGERGMVARVFVNRLEKGMPLQSDPTVVYAIESEQGVMQRPLYRKDWKFDHPYNTYIHTGLPPGPICHPGRAALVAVLNPPPGDALFFVATGKGGHYFARTLKEHNRNIARYKRALREQTP